MAATVVQVPPRRPWQAPQPGRVLLRRPPVVNPAVAQSVPHILTVEAAWGANLAADPGSWIWTDISADVRDTDDDPGVVIVRGRSDQSGQTQPARVTFGLNNFAGSYTPRNASSPYYPYVRVNTPIRVSVNTGDGSFVRAVVYAASWQASWDAALALPTVKVTAVGLLQALQQNKVIGSALSRVLAGASGYFYRGALSLLTSPVRYWPMEDVSGSISVAEYFGNEALKPTGAISYAASSTMASSLPLPTWPLGAQVVANIPPYTASSPVSWSVACAMMISAAPSAQVTLMEITTPGTGPFLWHLKLDTSRTVTIDAYTTGNVQTIVPGTATMPLATPVVVVVAAVQQGSDINITVTIQNASTSAQSPNVAFGYTLTPVSRIKVAVLDSALSGMTIGHLAVYNNKTVYAGGITGVGGFQYENPRIRFERLCLEAGIPSTVPGKVLEFSGDPRWSQGMGVQTSTSLVALLRECEASGGLLSDGLRPGLTFLQQTVNAATSSEYGRRYNRPVELLLDMALGQLPPGWRPVEDDTLRRNSWTVSQPAGTSGTYTDTSGPQGTAAIGWYGDQTTVNVVQPGLIDQAAWRTHTGTVEQMRYPVVPLNLRGHPELIPTWRACDIGSRVRVANLPSTHGQSTVDLVIEGYTEQIRAYEWLVGLNCSSYEPWRVATIQGATDPWRLDTGGSTLASGVNTSATSLSIATSVLPLWTTTATYPADFPFDIDVDGEQITVTAISGTSSPQTFTVTRSVNGVVKSHNANATVRLWRPPVIAL